MVYDWRNCNETGLKNYFNNINWSESLLGKDVESQWKEFQKVVDTGLQQYVPMKKRCKLNKCVWMTKKVKNLINYKNRIFKLVKHNRTEENVKKLKVAEKNCKNAVRKAKKNYEKKLTENGGNKKQFHAYIRSKTKSKFPVGPIKQYGETITDSKEIAEALNQYFGTVFTHETGEPIPACPINSNIKLETVVITQSKIIDKINKLKKTSAPGPDGISSRLLQNHINSLSFALSIIYENSLESGIVPLEWKIANVTPIFKKGAKGNVENYRPISLTSIPCKILESILKDAIMDHLLDSELLKSTQHGFMKNKSTVTNLLEFFEKITGHVDDGDCVDVIYLDFSKAFDKVPIKRLISKLKAHGIDGSLLAWISDWLTNRKQRTVLNGQFSTWISVLSGVPQGSVLGPILFIIFINDIDTAVDIIRQIMNKFADDTKLGQKINCKEDADMLQRCLDNLLSWADNWGMKFNVLKCSVIHFGRKNPKYEYKMNGTTLNQNSMEKDLGILIQSDLKPSEQCVTASRKATQALFLIQKSFLYKDQKTFVLLYKQFVRCHLEYASPVWSPWNTADINLLENIQIKAVKLINGLEGLSYQEKLIALNLESLTERRTKADLLLVYKIIKGFCDVDKKTWFSLVGASDRNTRLTSCPMNIKQQRFRTDVRKYFFSNRVVNYWNSLPVDVKMSNSISEFKNKLKKITIHLE